MLLHTKFSQLRHSTIGLADDARIYGSNSTIGRFWGYDALGVPVREVVTVHHGGSRTIIHHEITMNPTDFPKDTEKT